MEMVTLLLREKWKRNLIEKNLIPSDVRISVLTQAREALIRRTVESLVGVENSSRVETRYCFPSDSAKERALRDVRYIGKGVRI